MRPWNRSRFDEAGSASLEFIVATAILLIPLLYLTLALAEVQNQTLGAHAIGRHASRVIASGANLAHADRVALTLADEYGIDPDSLDLDVSCRGAGACPRAGALVTVRVRAQARLPFVPDILGVRAAVPVGSDAVQRISDYAESAR